MFDYTHAIVRSPAPSVVAGLRAGDGPDPYFAALQMEHDAYVEALQSLGLDVERLAAADLFPDSVFVEDPALVFGDGAIVLSLSAPSRAGEAALIAPTLESRFNTVLHMQGPGHADGGDVLVLHDRVIIGLSNRTDRTGAEELVSLLGRLGKKAEVAEAPPGILHFKTGCSLIDEETVFALPPMVNSPAFAGLRVVVVPDGEENAANMLRIGESILMGADFCRSREIVESLGIPTIGLQVEQIGRIDAGLSCMSLRWREKK